MSKHARTYSFESPLSITEIHERLCDLGAWQWVDVGTQRLVASLPPPDRGTVTIALQPGAYTVELEVDAAPENLQGIYDIVFAHLLPAISAAAVRPYVAAPVPPDGTQTRIFAYTFECPLGLAQMFAALNAAGPWTWFERDNDRLGDYISGAALRAPHRGIAKIYVEHGEWVVSVLLKSADQAAIANAERELFERVLPSIGARILAETEPLD